MFDCFKRRQHKLPAISEFELPPEPVAPVSSPVGNYLTVPVRSRRHSSPDITKRPQVHRRPSNPFHKDVDAVMFAQSASKKTKEALIRCFDVRRECASRAKHLKALFDDTLKDPREKSQIIDDYPFELYHLLHDLMCTFEPSAVVTKPSVEVDFALWVLEQIIRYAPDMVGRRWQQAAIRSLLSKCIRSPNVPQVRRTGIRIFLLWYQVIGCVHGRDDQLDDIFVTLLPTFDATRNDAAVSDGNDSAAYSEFSDMHLSEQRSNMSADGNTMERMLELFVRDTLNITWTPATRQQREIACIHFIFSRIVQFLIPPLFGKTLVAYAAETNFGGNSKVQDQAQLFPIADSILIARYKLMRWLYTNVHDYSQPSTDRHGNTIVERPPPAANRIRQVVYEDQALSSLLIAMIRYTLHSLPVTLSGKVGALISPTMLMQRVVRIVGRQWLLRADASNALSIYRPTVCPTTVTHLLCTFYFNQSLTSCGERLAQTVTLSQRICAYLKRAANIEEAPPNLTVEVDWRQMLDDLLSVCEHVMQNPEMVDFARGIAPSLFQSILVIWVHVTGVRGVAIDGPLWDRMVIGCLRNESYSNEIVKVIHEECAKVCASVTRALSQFTYNVDLHDLPLQRTIKAKRQLLAQKLNVQQTSIENAASTTPTQNSTPSSTKEPLQRSRAMSLDLPSPGVAPPPPSLALNAPFSGGIPELPSPQQMRKHSPSTVVEMSSTSRRSSMLVADTNHSNHVVPNHGNHVGTSSANTSISSSVLTLASESDLHPGSNHTPSLDGNLPHTDGGSMSGTDGEVDRESSCGGGDMEELTPRRSHDEAHPSNDELIAKRWLLVWRRLIMCTRCVTTLCTALDTLITIDANQSVSATRSPQIHWLLRYMLHCLVSSKAISQDVNSDDQLTAIRCAVKVIVQPVMTTPPLDVQSRVISRVRRVLHSAERASAQNMVNTIIPSLLQSNVLCATWWALAVDCARYIVVAGDSPTQEVTLLHIRLCGRIIVLNDNQVDRNLRNSCASIVMNAVDNTGATKLTPTYTTALNTIVIYLCHVFNNSSVKEHDVELHDRALHTLLNELMSMAAGVTDDVTTSRKAMHVVDACSHVLRACVNRAKADANDTNCRLRQTHTIQIFVNSLRQLTAYESWSLVCARILVEITDWLLIAPSIRGSVRVESPSDSPSHRRSTSSEDIGDSLRHVREMCVQAIVETASEAHVCQSMTLHARASLGRLMHTIGQYPPVSFNVTSFDSHVLVDKYVNDDSASNHTWSLTASPNDTRLCTMVAHKDVYSLVDVRTLNGRHRWSVRRSAGDKEAMGDVTVSTDLWIAKVVDEETELGRCFERLDEKPQIEYSNSPNSTTINKSISSLQLTVTQAPSTNQHRPTSPPSNQHLAPHSSLLADLGAIPCSSNANNVNWTHHENNESLHRQLRHVNGLPTRETHKFGLLYVRQGQETKEAILANQRASRVFQKFVASLGWQVNTATHRGYCGGLNASYATTLTYYGDTRCECVYHVSTMLPLNEDGSWHDRLRHIGNDEVLIVWSEHRRPFSPNTIATDFADVLICIYPMAYATTTHAIEGEEQIHYYRVSIETKQSSLCDRIGPLYDGICVRGDCLPGLLRETAMNANRAVRQQRHSAHTPTGEHVDWSTVAQRYNAIKQVHTTGEAKREHQHYGDLMQQLLL